MLAFFSTLTGAVSAHPYLAYATVLLLALSEAIPIIGVVVPGTAVIVGIAALIPDGVIKFWPLLAAAFFGAVLGDGLSFSLGNRYQKGILHRWPFDRNPGSVARSEGFIFRHGGKSIFLARFVPGVRAFVPLLSGILKMPNRKFYTVNVISALLWAPAHIVPGMLLGTAFHGAGAAAGPLAVLAIVVTILLWASIWIVRYTFRCATSFLAAMSERLRAWASTRDDWLAGKIQSVLLLSRSKAKVLVIAGLLLKGSTLLFLGILKDVISGGPFVQTDVSIHGLLQDLRTPWGDAVMVVLTELGDTVVVLSIVVGVLFWLLRTRAWRTASYWVAAVGSASAVNTVMKISLHRARPIEGLYSGWSDFSFPSGHTTVNAVLYGFLIVILARRLPSARRAMVTFAAAILIVLIAFSRVYLGAHWFSDVIGGLAFATGWMSLIGVAFLQHPNAANEPSGGLIFALMLLVLAGAYNVYVHHTSDMARYAVRENVPALAEKKSWSRDWQEMPVRRIDLDRVVEKPLTL